MLEVSFQRFFEKIEKLEKEVSNLQQEQHQLIKLLEEKE